MCKKKESWEDFLSFFLYPILPTFALGNQNKTERQWCREQQYLRVRLVTTMSRTRNRIVMAKDIMCENARRQLELMNRCRMPQNMRNDWRFMGHRI